MPEAQANSENELPVLIVGGGIAGMSLAILLRRAGRCVELVELDPAWKVYGAGISITGPTYRAFKRLGLLSRLREGGFFIESGARICAPDGTVLADLPGHRLEPDLPAAGGILRPVLHEILSSEVRASGADVRLGVTIAGWEELEESLSVEFTDGSRGEYAFMVGADGVFSSIRQQLFPDAPKPEYTGQYCWRINAERPPEIDRAHFFVAGDVTAGLMPVSETSMYMWLLEQREDKVWLDPEELAPRLKQIMAPFGGVMGRIRDEIGPESVINARPLEAVLVPAPWYKGRVLLIGDAAHATTPHLASGAGISVEDALVLSEVLAAQSSVGEAFEAFMARRFERCRLVVENSIAIGRMQQAHGSPDELAALMRASGEALTADI